MLSMSFMAACPGIGTAMTRPDSSPSESDASLSTDIQKTLTSKREKVVAYLSSLQLQQGWISCGDSEFIKMS
jgi:NADH:ubiquinone oxidoreductase subunit E